MKFASIFGVILYGFLIKTSASDSSETRTPSLFCTDLNPQNSLNFDHIMGMWYGIEVLTHHDSEEGTFYYDSCIEIHLSDITNEIPTTTEQNLRDYSVYTRNPDVGSNEYRRQYRYLRLMWQERGSNLEYTLRYNNSRRGFWISSAPQKGTMLDLPYQQFSGTVQVMKAVGNHLVLTFCHSLPGSQLFTVVLARQSNSLSYDEIQSIRNLLRRRGLSTASVRKVCSNGSSNLTISSIFLFVLCFIAKSI